MLYIFSVPFLLSYLQKIAMMNHFPDFGVCTPWSTEPFVGMFCVVLVVLLNSVSLSLAGGYLGLANLKELTPNSSYSVRDGLEMPGCAEQAPGQRMEKPSGVPVSETRLRGSSVASSVASEPRSRSSSLNSTDSGSGLQAAPELGRGSQPASQRFSVISSEDFDQELVVKPLKVKKKRKKKTGTIRSRARTDSCLLRGVLAHFLGVLLSPNEPLPIQ